MKKLSTEITTKKGIRKIVFVEVDDDYAEWLLTQPQSVYHDAVLFEYRTSCIERKETRYVQSLDASIENGFSFADETANMVEEIETRMTLQQAVNQLNSHQQWFVKQIYILRRKQVEVARELGITESAMTQQISIIKRELKKILKKILVLALSFTLSKGY